MTLKKALLRLIRGYYQIYFLISGKRALKSLFNLFTSPKFQKVRPKEQPYLEGQNENYLKIDGKRITYYRWNNLADKTVLLLHGWEGNAGSWGKFIDHLFNEGYEIIAINAPAHHPNEGKQCTIRDYQKTVEECIRVFRVSIIIAHSFGTAAVALALESLKDHQIEKLVSISAPNRMIDIVTGFTDFIGLNSDQRHKFFRYVTKQLNLTFEDAVVSKALSQKRFDLLTIHDVEDRVVGVENAKEISFSQPNSSTYIVENTGHYKILWNQDVVHTVAQFLKDEKSLHPEQELSKTI